MNSGSDAKEEEAHEAIENANASLAEYQRVHQWLVWPEPDFPRTPTGKPRLSLIAVRAAKAFDGSTQASAHAGTLDDLLAKFSVGNGRFGEIGEGPEAQFARPRGADECA